MRTNEYLSLLICLISLRLSFQYGVRSGQLLSDSIGWKIEGLWKRMREMTEQRQNDVTLSSPSSSPLHRWPCSAPPQIFWVGMDDGHMERKLKTRRHLKLSQSLPFKTEKTSGPREISAIERENKRLRQRRFIFSRAAEIFCCSS